jgi:hypothetical protein
MAARTIRILGLDPGLQHTGWGLIESDGYRLLILHQGLAEAIAICHVHHRNTRGLLAGEFSSQAKSLGGFENERKKRFIACPVNECDRDVP